MRLNNPYPFVSLPRAADHSSSSRPSYPVEGERPRVRCGSALPQSSLISPITIEAIRHRTRIAIVIAQLRGTTGAYPRGVLPGARAAHGRDVDYGRLHGDRRDR